MVRQRGLAVLLALAWSGLPGCGDCNRPDELAEVPVAPADAGAEAADARKDAAEPAPDRAELPIFRLGPNILLAHAQRGEALFLDAGSAGFAKYLRFGIPALRWRLQQEREGVRVAVPERAAAIEVPLTAAQAASGAIRLGVHASAPGRIALKVDGRKAGEAELAPGWQVVAIDAEEGRLQAGANIVVVETQGAEPPGIAWLQFGSAAAVPAERAASPAPAVFDHEADTLVLGRDAGLVYHLFVPETGRLLAAVVPAADAAPAAASAGADGDVVQVDGDERAGGCVVRARAEAGIGSVEAALSGPRALMDLSALGGRVVRLELRAEGCERVRLQEPRMTVAGATRVGSDGERPRFVVLWLMSGLRADRVRPFAPWARSETPVLERLAQTGLSVSPSWAQSPQTQAARAALWTGRYPIRRSALGGPSAPTPAGAQPGTAAPAKNRAGKDADKAAGTRLRARAPALGVEMREAGFRTVAVTAAMDAQPGFADGFELWERVAPPAAPGAAAGAAGETAAGDAVLAQALTRLEERYREGPVFLLLETADARLPWAGHRPWLDRYDPGAYEGPFADGATLAAVDAEPRGDAARLADLVQCDETPSERDLARLRAIYDATASYQDALLGQLVDRLAQWGIFEQTLLVVVSDHGQETWEDGRCGHGASLRESLLAVPLLLHHPGQVPGGQVHAGGAEAVDVLPSLLRLAGVPVPEPVQGRPLVEVARAPGYPQPMFAAVEGAAHAVRVAGWKLVVGAGGAALFDLSADPGEQRSAIQERPFERQFASDILSLHVLYRARWNQRSWGVASNLSAAGWLHIEAPTDAAADSAPPAP